SENLTIMLRILIISLSILLSLGLFAEKYFPYLKEVTIAGLFLYVLIKKENHFALKEKIKEAFPLFLIFLILLVLGAILPYHLDGESVINFKFLVAIIFFVFLSTFFNIHPKYVQTSLISFGVGTGILSVLFAAGFFGAEAYEIRNDRLFLLGENPNSLSVRVSLGVLFLISGAIENSLKISKIKRILLLVPIPFMFNLILASGSKGSFLLCISSVAIYLFFLKNVSKWVKTFIIFVSIIIFFIALSFFFQSTLYDRFLNSDLTTGRSDIWEKALGIFLDNPMGVGEVGYKIEIYRRIGNIIDTHNLFLYLLVTGGFLSLFAFLYFLYRMFLGTFRKYKNEKNIVNFVIFFSMIFVMSKTGGVLTYLIMWYFFACINNSSVTKKITP